MSKQRLLSNLPQQWQMPLNWFGVLLLPPVWEVFLRQVYFTGIQAMGTVLLRGTVIGTFIIAYLIRELNADVAITTNILLLFVFREAGPLLAALLVIFRSGSAATSELALMQITGEVRMLRRLGVGLFDFLVLPRIMGITLATVMLTIYLQIVIVSGGIVFAPLLIDTSISQLLDSFLKTASLADIGYSLIKSLAFGLIISAIACYSGLSFRSREIGVVPQVVTRAMMRSFGYIMAFEVAFSYFVFGVLMFGLFEAEV